MYVSIANIFKKILPHTPVYPIKILLQLKDYLYAIATIVLISVHQFTIQKIPRPAPQHRSSFPFNSPWRSKFPRTARSLERAKCILISVLSGARLWNRSPRETIGKIERAPRRHPANISFLLAIQKGKGEEYWPLWLHSSFGISYSLYASSISLGRRCLSPREGRHLMHAHACTCAA